MDNFGYNWFIHVYLKFGSNGMGDSLNVELEISWTRLANYSVFTLP